MTRARPALDDAQVLYLCTMLWLRLELDCQPDATDLADMAEGGAPLRPMTWPCSYCGETLYFDEAHGDCAPF